MNGKEPRGVNLDGQKVRRLRKVQGEELIAFAERIGVTPGYVSHLENNRRKPSPSVFGRICNALGVEDGAELLADEAVPA
jgi:transcriptional regulator with XRE-family HTH domain